LFSSTITQDAKLPGFNAYDVPQTQTGVQNIGLDRIDQVSLPLDGTYTYKNTGKGVKAFIIDTGIYLEHTQFEGRASCGFDATLGEESDIPCEDRFGHGTFMAGLVGGKDVGVAKEVELVGVKVATRYNVTVSGIIAGFEYVAQLKLDDPDQPMVAVFSISGAPFPTIDAAAFAVTKAGATLVVSAGNDGMDACEYSPQRIPQIITVGAHLPDDSAAPWSNYGPCVDLYAPGDELSSTWKNGKTSVNRIVQGGGTSFSAPLVAGAAVLKLEENPNWKPNKVRNSIVKDSLKKVLTDVKGPKSTNRLLQIPI